MEAKGWTNWYCRNRRYLRRRRYRDIRASTRILFQIRKKQQTTNREWSNILGCRTKLQTRELLEFGKRTVCNLIGIRNFVYKFDLPHPDYGRSCHNVEERIMAWRLTSLKLDDVMCHMSHRVELPVD